MDQVVRRNNISEGTGWSYRFLLGKGVNCEELMKHTW